MADSPSNRRSLIRRPAALDVLAERDFRWFLTSAAFADLAITLRFVALAWVMLEITDSAAGPTVAVSRSRRRERRDRSCPCYPTACRMR